MFDLKRYFLVFNLFFFCLYFHSQKNISFCFIFNDSKLTREDIRSKVNFIVETSKIKKGSIEIIHYSENYENIDNWIYNKTDINYKPSKKDCSFDLCEKVSSIIDYVKTEKSRIYSTNQIYCELQIESILLKDSDQSTMREKIIEELDRLSNNKIKTTVFFMFDRDPKFQDNELSFDQEKLTVLEGETIKLNPIISADNITFSWFPETGLSCTNCKNPELKATESITYECTVTDSNGCNSIKKSIHLEIEKQCNCQSMTKNEILLKNHPEKKIMLYTKDSDCDWTVFSKESGDFIFDVVVKPSCADSFQVKIVNQENKEFYNMNYQRDDIEYSYTQHPFLKNFKDHFLFRIDISDQKSEMSKQTHKYFKLIIIPFLNGQECFSAQYTSPKLEFSPCE
jgi:hypothetical protein